MSVPTGAPSGAVRAAAPDVIIAAGVILLGAATLFGAARITVPLSSNVVGPRALPYAVGVVLMLSGLAVLADALRGRLGAPEEGEDVDANAPTDWICLSKITLAFVVHIAVVDLVGWALAGALLFTLVAWSLGANIVKAALTGLVIGFVAHALFVSALGVTLPPGPFEGVPFLDG